MTKIYHITWGAADARFIYKEDSFWKNLNIFFIRLGVFVGERKEMFRQRCEDDGFDFETEFADWVQFGCKCALHIDEITMEDE